MLAPRVLPVARRLEHVRRGEHARAGVRLQVEECGVVVARAPPAAEEDQRGAEDCCAARLARRRGDAAHLKARPNELDEVECVKVAQRHRCMHGAPSEEQSELARAHRLEDMARARKGRRTSRAELGPLEQALRADRELPQVIQREVHPLCWRVPRPASRRRRAPQHEGVLPHPSHLLQLELASRTGGHAVGARARVGAGHGQACELEVHERVGGRVRPAL